jgi:thiamine-monophosphate kinase
MGRHEEVGEFELIARLREIVRAAGAPEGPGVLLASGDDAAVFAAAGELAISVDAIVEGVHFTRPAFGLADVGHKALAAALSDLAAMGARGGEALIVLGIPQGLGEDLSSLDDLARGLGECAAAHGIAIVGGDVTRAPALTLAVTVTGRVGEAGPVKRSGASPGDFVAVTGELGGAAAGLLLLGGEPEPPGEGVGAQLRRRQLRPEPRLGGGLALSRAGATALIDLSDGLAGDARHVARASDVRLQLDAAALPIQAGVAEVARATGRDPLDLALGGGEDYELLVCIPPGRFTEAVEAVSASGTELTRIGIVAESAGRAGVEFTGAEGTALRPAGFDQLRAPLTEAEA